MDFSYIWRKYGSSECGLWLHYQSWVLWTWNNHTFDHMIFIFTINMNQFKILVSISELYISVIIKSMSSVVQAITLLRTSYNVLVYKVKEWPWKYCINKMIIARQELLPVFSAVYDIWRLCSTGQYLLWIKQLAVILKNTTGFFCKATSARKENFSDHVWSYCGEPGRRST